MAFFAIELSTRKVEILGIRPQPNGPWMEQIARNVSGEGGFLADKKYLIHDRDPLYAAEFASIPERFIHLSDDEPFVNQRRMMQLADRMEAHGVDKTHCLKAKT